MLVERPVEFAMLADRRKALPRPHMGREFPAQEILKGSDCYSGEEIAGEQTELFGRPKLLISTES